jgi:ABC-2 type transport system ATP-binding protein
MIEAHDLTRRYGDFTAVENVTFSVGESEIVGILGPNGAGKTTTIRMLTGFLPPTRGTVSINGRDLLRDPLEARRDLGYLPENVALYPEMRVNEYLAYRGRLEGLKGAELRRRSGEAIERCLLSEVDRQVIGTLSKGYRQRVGLAMAILHQPKVLILDEPTVGLDPKQIIAIRELIRELGQERTLLLSTHILPEVELLCDRVVIFDGGHVVAQGTPSDLRERWTGSLTINVVLKNAEAGARSVLEGIPDVTGVEETSGDGAAFAVSYTGDTDPREHVFRAAVENGWTLLELSRTGASLEEVFVRLTTRDETADGIGVPDAGEEEVQ